MEKTVLLVIWLAILTTITPTQAQDKSDSVAIVERGLESYGDQSYEITFRGDGRVVWTWYGLVDGRKRTRARRVDPEAINALFARLFSSSNKETCIQHTGGVDAPVNMIFFSRTGSLDALRAQGFAVSQQQERGVFESSCTIQNRFDQAIQGLESMAGPRPALLGTAGR